MRESESTPKIPSNWNLPEKSEPNFTVKMLQDNFISFAYEQPLYDLEWGDLKRDDRDIRMSEYYGFYEGGLLPLKIVDRFYGLQGEPTDSRIIDEVDNSVVIEYGRDFRYIFHMGDRFDPDVLYDPRKYLRVYFELGDKKNPGFNDLEPYLMRLLAQINYSSSGKLETILFQNHFNHTKRSPRVGVRDDLIPQNLDSDYWEFSDDPSESWQYVLRNISNPNKAFTFVPSFEPTKDPKVSIVNIGQTDLETGITKVISAPSKVDLKEVEKLAKAENTFDTSGNLTFPWLDISSTLSIGLKFRYPEVQK